MSQARTEHHLLGRETSEVYWAGLCGEHPARKRECPAGMGGEGEGVSVGLLSCQLQTCCCLPTASPPQKHGSA